MKRLVSIALLILAGCGGQAFEDGAVALIEPDAAPTVADAGAREEEPDAAQRGADASLARDAAVAIDAPSALDGAPSVDAAPPPPDASCVVHDNGLGYHWCDVWPLKTYTMDEAVKACGAFPGTNCVIEAQACQPRVCDFAHGYAWTLQGWVIAPSAGGTCVCDNGANEVGEWR